MDWIKECTDFISESFTDVSESGSTFNFSSDYADIRDSFEDLIRIVHEHSSIFGSFIIKEAQGPRRFFELSGGELQQSNGFQDDEVNDVDYDHHDLVGFQRSRDSDYTEAADYLRDVCDPLNETIRLEVTGIIRKEKIESKIGEDLSLTNSEAGFGIQYWSSPSSLDTCLSGLDPDEVVEQVFSFDSLPVIVFGEDHETVYGPAVVTSVCSLHSVDLQELVEKYSDYRSYLDTVESQTDWDNDLTPIHPEPVLVLESILSNIGPTLLYSLLSVFSQEVKRQEGATRFVVSHDPELYLELDDSFFSSDIETGLIDGWKDLYSDFKPQMGEESFRTIWQQALAEEANDIEDDIEKAEIISSSTGQICSTVHSIEQEIIKENFEGLSEALDETQALMADITSRLSDAASGTSRQIQALGFTLLGAIIANVFLVLRWSENRLVLPFVMSVLVIILTFYLPLIQGRINDLDSIIEEASNDFELYRRRIRRFNKDLFRFNQLKDRIDAYIGIAKTQRDRAQTWVNLAFYAILVAWSSLAAFMTCIFPLRSSQTAVTVLSIAVFIGISVPHRYSPVDRKYFDRRMTFFAVLIGLLALGTKTAATHL